MDRNKIKERLELALRPAEPPTLEEVLKHVSTRGALRGPVDWVFPAWMQYVEYATQKIAETFPLSEEERSQLLDFRDAMKRLLLEAWMQAKEKLTTLYKAVAEGTYRLEGNKLYAPDGTWMCVRGNFTPHILIRGVSASASFPDVLKLPRERLELLQLGWRASDESNERIDRPHMGTTQPWQVFAWAAVRYGSLYIRVDLVNLTRKGVSVKIRIITRSWKQKWSKDEAIDLVASHFRHGEWTPLLTMWLGDGSVNLRNSLRNRYMLIIVAKEPWRLSSIIDRRRAFVATGRAAFEKLKEAASVYGVILDVLQSHKWIAIKLATDDAFRTAYKLKVKKRSIDRFRETYGQYNYASSIPHAKKTKPNTVIIAGIVMHLHVTGSKNGALSAQYYTRDIGEALTIADKLRAAGLNPNVVESTNNYVVYIATADLVKLAEKDETIRKTIAQYLTEKAKNGTPRQKELAEKLLKRIPLFQPIPLLFS